MVGDVILYAVCGFFVSLGSCMRLVAAACLE